MKDDDLIEELRKPVSSEAADRIEKLKLELSLAVHDANYLLDKATKQHNRIEELEEALEKAEDTAWREALGIARGTNADMRNTARQAYQVICGAINDAVNNPKLRTLQGRVDALKGTDDGE